MAMTRLQMVTEICDIVGKHGAALSSSGGQLQTRVITYLNWAQQRIAKHYAFQELMVLNETAVLAPSVKTYPLEAGTNNLGLARVNDINSIMLNDSENSRKLIRWHYRKFDRYYPRPENFSTQRPKIYTRWGNNLIFFPIPDDDYLLNIRYSQTPQDLDSDAQTSDFEDKDQLLVTAGVLETYLALEQYDDAKIWYELFVGQLKDAVDSEDDVDWEPEAEPTNSSPGYSSGTPWSDPSGSGADPLARYL